MKRLFTLSLAILIVLSASLAFAAPSFVLSTTARTAVANATALNELLNNGHLHLYDGTAPGPNSAPNGTLLSDHTLPASGSNTAANGVLTLGTVANVNASESGTVSYFRLLQSDNSTVVAEGNVATSGATITINTTTITSGGPVAVTGLAITVPTGS